MFSATTYYIFAAFVILCLAGFSLIQIFPQIRLQYESILLKIRDVLGKNKTASKITSILKSYIKKPAVKAGKLSVKYLGFTSGHIQKAEGFFQRALPAVSTEPVNLMALVIRKCYTESPAPLVALTAGLIVVFYFILTIF
jgi:hypothetical protein